MAAPDGDCLCLRKHCFHSFFLDDDRKADVPRRCATCTQKIEQGKGYKVGEQAKGGVTVVETVRARSGVAHAPSLHCGACYIRQRTIKEPGAAVNNTSCPDVMEPPRLRPLDRVQARVKDVISSGELEGGKLVVAASLRG